VDLGDVGRGYPGPLLKELALRQGGLPRPGRSHRERQDEGYDASEHLSPPATRLGFAETTRLPRLLPCLPSFVRRFDQFIDARLLQVRALVQLNVPMDLPFSPEQAMRVRQLTAPS